MDQEKNDKINFKAVDSGLGFHLFSEGMPYQSPNTNKNLTLKKQTQKGDSPSLKPIAPKSETPGLRPLPKTEEITAPRSQTSSLMSGATAAGQPTFSQSILTPVKQTEAPTTDTATVTTYGFSYSIRRTFAFILDHLLNLFIAAALFGFAFWKFDLSTKYLLTGQLYLFALTFLAVFSWALITAQEIAFGTSFGKHFFGLKIQGNVFLVLIRSILFIPSFVLAPIGLFMAFFHSKRKCLHDLITGIQPTPIDSTAK